MGTRRGKKKVKKKKEKEKFMGRGLNLMKILS